MVNERRANLKLGLYLVFVSAFGLYMLDKTEEHEKRKNRIITEFFGGWNGCEKG